MKYPDDYLGKIFNCDCMEIMKQLPDKCIDLCLCDPPYGIGLDRENKSMSCGLRKDGSFRKHNNWKDRRPKGYETLNWDSSAPDKSIFDEIFRVSNRQIIWGGELL